MKKRLLGKYDGLKYGWLKDAKHFLLLFVIVALVFRFLLGISFVKGASMEPTLRSGEMVFYSRIYPECRRGDVVSVRVPEGKYYVKRVIAVEGDTVDLQDGMVYVNGEHLEEPYVKGETFTQEGPVVYPYTLKENQVFVMGDNREVSMDSRSFGAVGRRQIKGRILFYVGRFFIRKL